MTKTTIVIGAGATQAEAMRLGVSPLPPLDKGFFSGLAAHRPHEFQPISDYMREQYGVNILDSAEDGLEAIMSVIYTDIRHSQLGPEAARPFRALIRSVNAELSASSNKMKADRDSYLYRIVKAEIDRGTALQNLAFVTFNYDLQIEKALEALERDGFTTEDGVALNFPYCYHLPRLDVTSPPKGREVFRVGDEELSGVSVYKLHGSLNWYSSHNSKNPSMDALLRTGRKIRLTQQQSPPMGMTVAGARRTYAFPVVIPPVLNKSAILPSGFASVWKDAEDQLAHSEHLVVFGYSCPLFDLEAANLVARSLRGNANLRGVSIIDPTPEVIIRFAKLTSARRIAYYRDADTYLA